MDFYTDNEGFFYYSKDGVEKIYPMKKMEAWIMENLRIAELNGEKSDFKKEYKNYIKGGNFDSPEIYKKVEETLKSLGNGNLNKGIKAYALEVEKKINLEKQLEEESNQYQQEKIKKQQIDYSNENTIEFDNKKDLILE